MDLTTQILAFFGNHIAIVSFLGAMVGGEETLVFLTIMASRDFFNIWFVSIFFYLGIMVSDTMWYYVGKSKLFDFLIKVKFISNTYSYWGKLLDKSTEKSDIQALFVTKFLYGFRIPTIMYLARERLSIRLFLKYSVFTNFLWTGIIILISWSIGKGIVTAEHFTKSITLDIFLIGLTLTLFIILMRFISTKVKKWLQH